MQSKNNAEKASERLADHHGDTLNFIFERFTVDKMISNIKKNIQSNENRFTEKFMKRKNPQDSNKEATEAHLKSDSLVSSVNKLDGL